MVSDWMFRVGLVTMGALAWSSSAHAAPTQYPGILYVPVEDVELLASSDPQCTGLEVHSGKSCGGEREAATIPAHADAEALGTDLAAALADFDVTVTHTRPPKYLPYLMLLPSDVDVEASVSYTCTGGGIDCSAASRRGIGTTIGGSANCMNPDILHASLYVFGRMSGLEGVANLDDPMGYVPDYMNQVTGYIDDCSEVVQQQGFDDRGDPVVLPLECEEDDHTGCDPGMQNSVADLTATYGPAPADADVDPPVLTILAPEDGQVFVLGDEVEIDGMVEDDDAFVGAMWTVQGEGLVQLLGVDTFEYCTNTACIPGEGQLAGMEAPLTGWEEDDAAKATDSEFTLPTIRALPVGDYTVTFVAADMHGNVAEAITIAFTIEPAPPSDDTTGPPPADDGTPPPTDDSSSGGASTGVPSDESSDGSTSGAQDDDDSSGCSCTSGSGRPAALALGLGLVGLAAGRRRRAAG
jgi:MYXO-CTERM domain-containing protein